MDYYILYVCSHILYRGILAHLLLGDDEVLGERADVDGVDEADALGASLRNVLVLELLGEGEVVALCVLAAGLEGELSKRIEWNNVMLE